MQKILIDKNLFNPENPLSKGLVTGLKKLEQKGFLFYSEETGEKEKSLLNKLFQIEEIKINNSVQEKFKADFIITTRSSKKENVISINSKGKVKNFSEAVNELIKRLRKSEQHRKTRETDVKISLSLDGTGNSIINTGIGFFDHMLEQISKHANINMNIRVKGDLHVDEHHTVEDVGITLGNALSEALGDKKGIKRYGFFLPMDDAVANCAVDLGGRTYLNFNCKFEREFVGEFPTELTEEFFRGLASGLKANIFIRAKGRNDHHKIEAIFKSFAKALNEACRIDDRNEGSLPSTKGIL